MKYWHVNSDEIHEFIQAETLDEAIEIALGSIDIQECDAEGNAL